MIFATTIHRSFAKVGHLVFDFDHRPYHANTDRAEATN